MNERRHVRGMPRACRRLGMGVADLRAEGDIRRRGDAASPTFLNPID